MSTGTKTEINKLVARCRRVKWGVEQASNGYRITFDDNSVYLIHESYSDSNAAKRVERQLGKKGLFDKEAELEAARDKAKTATLATQRKKAADDARKLAEQESALAKAAGPYAGPEEVPLEWCLAQHPAPWMRWAIITPAMAEAILKRNIDNRPLYPSTRAYYRGLIDDGHMVLTHQGMAMDIRGVLQDGQHRLHACADSGKPIETAFFVGMPVTNFKVIDECRNRSIADLLGKDDVQDRNLVGTTMRLIAAYREPFPRAFLKVKTPNEVLYNSFKGDPDRVAEAVKFSRQHYAKARIVGAALGAATYLLREANGRDNNFVRAFLNGLVSGVKGSSRVLLDTDDPRLMLRETMQRTREQGHRMRGIDQMGYILLAWNHVVDGSQAGRRIKWTEGRDDIPQIVVCRDRGATASAAPDFLRGEFTA